MKAKFTEFREYELLANFIHPYYCVPFINYNFLVLKSCQNRIETKKGVKTKISAKKRDHQRAEILTSLQTLHVCVAF